MGDDYVIKLKDQSSKIIKLKDNSVPRNVPFSKTGTRKNGIYVSNLQSGAPNRLVCRNGSRAKRRQIGQNMCGSEAVEQQCVTRTPSHSVSRRCSRSPCRSYSIQQARRQLRILASTACRAVTFAHNIYHSLWKISVTLRNLKCTVPKRRFGRSSVYDG